MTDTQTRQFMQDFFERYYQKLEQLGNGIAVMRPLGESDKTMWREDSDPKDEWKAWKLIPSTITDQDTETLEKTIGINLPKCLNAFLTVYHHYFDNPAGENPVSAPFKAVRNSWNPLLVKHGYLPFAWDDGGFYIRCIDLTNMPNEEKCVYHLHSRARSVGASGRPVPVASSEGAVSDGGTALSTQGSPGGNPPHLC